MSMHVLLFRIGQILQYLKDEGSDVASRFKRLFVLNTRCAPVAYTLVHWIYTR